MGLGDFCGGTDAQGRIKSEVSVEAIKKMGYDAIVLGEREMTLGEDFVFGDIEKSGIPVVSNNLQFEGKLFGEQGFIIKKGGIRIGFLGVTLDQQRVGQEEWSIREPVEAVKEALPGLKEKADIVILMSHIGYRQTVALVEHLEGIDIALIGHEGRRLQTPRTIGSTILVQSGSKGKYLGRLDLVYDPDACEIVSYSGELISLAPEIEDDGEMAQLYSEYQERIKDMVKDNVQERSSEVRASRTTGYLGAVWCRSCHSEIFKSWNSTPHADAFVTLKKKGEEYNPECVACHTTGYGQGGFTTLTETPEFRNVQCEACHGVSSKHVADKGESPMLAQNSSICQKCHTGEFGEGFDYETMKSKVHHVDE